MNGPCASLRLRASVTMPDMQISTDSMDFGPVQCGQCKVITIQLHNNQHVKCEWTSLPTDKERKLVTIKHFLLHFLVVSVKSGLCVTKQITGHKQSCTWCTHCLWFHVKYETDFILNIVVLKNFPQCTGMPSMDLLNHMFANLPRVLWDSVWGLELNLSTNSNCCGALCFLLCALCQGLVQIYVFFKDVPLTRNKLLFPLSRTKFKTLFATRFWSLFL